MATRMELNAALSRMFGLFLFVIALGNLLVGSLDFAIVFGVVGFVFLSFSGYVRSSPEKFSHLDEPVSDRLIKAVVIGGWGLILLSAFVIAGLFFG